MSAFAEKVLWTVFMRNPAEEDLLLAHAQHAGCNAVAIRTSNDRLAGSIARFHKKNIKVYGWRWPAVTATPNNPTYYAPEQARFVAETLIPAGLDGYFADIESDGPGINDWNHASLAPLATAFSERIKAAAPPNFRFGVTAGCRQPINDPEIPWQAFQPHIDLVMPQTYWRWTNNKGVVEDINGGTPASAVNRGEKAWASVFPGMAQVPILGELNRITPGEIKTFADIVASKGITSLHAYTNEPDLSEPVLAMLAAV